MARQTVADRIRAEIGKTDEQLAKVTDKRDALIQEREALADALSAVEPKAPAEQ